MVVKEYIEREAVLRHKRKMSSADFGGEFWDEAVLCEEILKIPKADVVEVKHGRWKDRAYLNDYIWAECSNCGFIEENIKVVKLGCSSTDFVGVKWYYCPKCGAKMDSECK